MSDIRPGCSHKLKTVDRLVLHHQRMGPAVGVNMTKCKNVHIGPSIISISQNVENVEVPKDKILGLEQENGKRPRCNIFVCACWTLAATSLLAFLILFFTLASNPPKRLVLDIKEPWYFTRDKWNADNEREALVKLKLPVAKVLIGHSGERGQFCQHIDECINAVFTMQKDHQYNHRWADIGPNFLVGGKGLVFEGRGGNYKGAMVESFNHLSITIMFIGDYIINEPYEEQFAHVNVLLQELEKKRVLVKDYEVFGHCQVKRLIISPGLRLMDKMDRFPRWNPADKGYCDFGAVCVRTISMSNITDNQPL